MHSTMPPSFAHLWVRGVAQFPGNTFLRFRDDNDHDTEWTYREFGVLVDRVVARLHALGVRRGCAVHLCLRNSPAFLLVWFATARLGAFMVPVDPASRPRDLANQVTRTRPTVGVAAVARADTYRAGVVDQVPHVIEVYEDARDAGPDSPLLGDPTAMPQLSTPVGTDRLAIMFTSGTTSEPKGVVLTQTNYGYLAQTMASLAALRSAHRWFVTLPLFHGNAQFYCFAPAVSVGASVALTSRFSASRWLAQVRDMAATHASLFAAPIRMILARTPEDAPPARLEHLWYAQNLAAGHFEELARLVGTRPRQLYGMTETTAIVTCDRSENPVHDSIGTVVPGREVRLLRPDDPTREADGDVGALALAGARGVDMFEGYLDNDAVNARSFFHEDGREWFRTGDLVRREPGGTLSFVGRIDDVIKVAGENVSLTEVEAALAQAPGVLEAAVLAQPDPIRDHVPVAYVVARDPAAAPTVVELQEWAEANLTPQSRPHAWHFLDELPRTSVGKIRRFKLTEGPS